MLEQLAPTAFVVVDSNVWIRERMLESDVGEALLYAITRKQALGSVPNPRDVILYSLY
jgi:hypothetical protein